MYFRHDINGLRAIAVLAVVLFHFNPQWLPGGFAGVDVFFVISGFLMTSIIFNSVEKNTFNLFKFYNARANRIIPVLAAMSAVMLIFGWFYLLPTDYGNLGKQVEKSSFFMSNILFSKGGGYFDTAEHTKWLLHTWSLSVEWQFYIFFPIIIVALKKYLSFANLKRVVIALFLISFIYCIYATNKDNKIAYFLLTSRAWEMLLGGLAFLYPISIRDFKLRISTQTLGLSLIIASYFLISKDTPWPGYMALFPVLGAYLIILSSYQNNILIKNPVFNHIGKWSYSIYVWHWPLVVLGIYFSFTDWWMYGIPLSILLGFLSYQFIEKINFPRFSSWKEIYKVKPFYIFLIIVSCGYIVKESDGMKFHYSKELLSTIAESENSNPYKCDSWYKNNTLDECKIGNTKNIKAIVIGDSHANSITTAVAASFDLKNEGIISIVTGGCPFIFDTEINGMDFCRGLNKQRMQWLMNNRVKYSNVPLIISGRWAHYVKGETDPERINGQNTPPLYSASTTEKDLLSVFSNKLNNSICLVSDSYQVYIMQPTPEMGIHIPKAMAKKIFFNKPFISSVSYQEYLTRSGDIRTIIDKIASKCNAKVLDPADTLCQSGKCISEYKGRSIYRDGDHLSEYGNKLLIPMFREALQP